MALDISDNLLEAQQAISLDPRVKVTLTHGETEYVYDVSRILNIKHPEQEDSQTAEILLDNSDGALTDLDFKGYAAVVSWGFNTSEGEEYAARPPQVVLDQNFYSSGDLPSGKLYCTLSLIGSPDRLRTDKASKDYEHHYSSVKTVKDMLTEVLSGTAVTENLVEEQTSADTDLDLRLNWHGCAQRLLILSRTVSKLSFKLKKTGSPTGDITYFIKASDDETTIATKVLGDASTLTTSYAWKEVTLDTPVAINDEVYIYPEYTDGAGSDYVKCHNKTANVKANESLSLLHSALGWKSFLYFDNAYKYTYAGGGIDCFSHCQSYTVTYDSEDSLIDSYLPKDAFNIKLGETRWSVVQRLLSYTKCRLRFGNDGQAHIFLPTTSGEDYDYEYSLESGHTFFSKALRKGLIIPNKMVVESFPDDDDQYTGSATDATSFALLPKSDFKQMKLISNAQATSIAEAIISVLQVAAQKGSATVPMNVGAEIYDYVKVTDEREEDSRIGNIGYLCRRYSSGRDEPVYEMDFSFGKVAVRGIAGTRRSLFSRAEAILKMHRERLGQTETPEMEARLTLPMIQPLLDDMITYINLAEEDIANIFARLNDLETSYIPELAPLEQEQVEIPQILEAGARVVYIKCLSATTALTTGDGKAYFTVPDELNGMNIIAVAAAVYTVSSSGLPTIQIHNLTKAQDILSTRITIDENEKTSYGAATPPVINTSYDKIEMADILRIDCDVAGTGTKGLDVPIVCKTPS